VREIGVLNPAMRDGLVLMRKFANRSRCSNLLLFVALVCQPLCLAQQPLAVQQVAPNLLLFSTRRGNVIASVGEDGALLIGTPEVNSTAEIEKVLRQHTKSPMRYVVIASDDPSHSDGDANWGRRGAFVAMQENALGLLGGHAMGSPLPLPPRLKRLGVDRPRVAFSDVLTFDLNGEAVHIVHQKPGSTNADFIAHFHVANIVYLGGIFSGNGYPLIDSARFGSLDGLLATLNSWTGDRFRVIPVHGAIANGADVQAFVDMIVAVKKRVQVMIKQRKSIREIQAARPTADFDGRWGKGEVTPRQFVDEVYLSLTTPPSQ
jgi:cyclase